MKARGLSQKLKSVTSSALVVVLACSSVAANEPATTGSDVVVQALALLGTPYRSGGSSPETGFDCSGLVRHVFAAALNRDLPRRSEEMGHIGQPVTRTELEPGDLVFFNTLQRAYSHVAIYLGDARFVHAPARGGKVRVESMTDRYWAARYDGARRLLPGPVRAHSAPPVPSLLADMEKIRP